MTEADSRLLWWFELGGIVAFAWVLAWGLLILAGPLGADLFRVFVLDFRMWLCPAVLWWVLGIPALFAR